MSKYSKKVERQLREARRLAESKNRKVDQKEESRQLKAEKKRIRKIIRQIDEIQSQENKKEKEVIMERRNLRKLYLDSLKVGNSKHIELARQSILTYEIGRKLEQETKGEITL